MLSAIPLFLLAAAPVPSGTATMSLEELIPLVSQAPAARAPEPPVGALVVRTELKGHLTPDALAVDAHFDVDVLGERWTRVPLLVLAPETFVSELPTIDNATVAVHEGAVCLFTRRAGRYALDIGLTVRGQGPHGVRRAQLLAAGQGLAGPMHLEADPALFTLVEPGEQVGDIYPKEGRWTVAWKTAGGEASRPRAVVRPPLEPSIPKATATWVSTLEGRASLRVRYGLRVDRELPVELQLPEGLRLERAVVNGTPVEAKVEDRKAVVMVRPASVGATEGTLELVLAEDLGVFHLSGQLELALPRVSWPVSEVQVDAHLPAVFNYRRAGGSLEALEKSDDATGDPALPGKVLRFRQYLVAATAPHLELGYSVDISNSYFH